MNNAPNPNSKVIVAMSGGVDSSVAALLLKQAGHDVVGVTMKLFDYPAESAPAYNKGCCTLDDVEDARRVCHILHVPHYVFNLQREFRAHVIDYFLAEYQQGKTPHPCIACNDRIKFSFLLRRARFLGASHVATGHYARILPGQEGWRLLTGLDGSKDQSYVLFGMNQNQLSQTLMPVGTYPKDEIRRMAADAGFPNAHKPDSQEICFIPLGDYRSFIQKRVIPKPGRLVNSAGETMGTHKGIEFYTVGQRRGLGITSPNPLYVTAIDPDSRDITIGPESELYSDTLWASNVNYIQGKSPSPGIRISVKIRYKSTQTPARLHPQDDHALLRFDEPQRAITPGQAVVFYRDDEVLGGGRISHPPKPDSRKPVGALREAPASTDDAILSLDGGFGANALP